MITRVANAVARELAARIFFHDRMNRQWRDFFLHGRAVVTAVAVARAASCGTQRASPVNARMPTCQSDGADLSPANPVVSRGLLGATAAATAAVTAA